MGHILACSLDLHVHVILQYKTTQKIWMFSKNYFSNTLLQVHHMLETQALSMTINTTTTLFYVYCAFL